MKRGREDLEGDGSEEAGREEPAPAAAAAVAADGEQQQPGDGQQPPAQQADEDDEDDKPLLQNYKMSKALRKGTECPYLDTISRQVGARRAWRRGAAGCRCRRWLARAAHCRCCRIPSCESTAADLPQFLRARLVQQRCSDCLRLLPPHLTGSLHSLPLRLLRTWTLISRSAAPSR